MKKSQKIIWAADKSKELYLEKQGFMEKIIDTKSVTIHSSFDTRLVESENEIDDKKYLITVGRLSRVKRIDFLIDVFNELHKNNKNMYFIICGDGEEKKTLISKAKELNLLDAILFEGNVNRNELGKYLSKSSVFMFASENEAMSLVVLESLYMGVPVVSTNVGDISYVVHDNKTGFIVNGYNVDDFKRCVEILLKNGKSAYYSECKKIAMQYTPQKMCEKINSEILDCLK